MAVAIASSKACCSSILYSFSRSNLMLACSGSNPDRKRRSVIFGSSLVLASTTLLGSSQLKFPVIALEQIEEREEEELEEEEERNVNLFQVLWQSLRPFFFSVYITEKSQNFCLFDRKLRRLLCTSKTLSFPKRPLMNPMSRIMQRSKGLVLASFGTSLVTLYAQIKKTLKPQVFCLNRC